MVVHRCGPWFSRKVDLRIFCIFVNLLLCIGPFARADDWPQWRGPARDGVAGVSGLPKDWPAAAPSPAWTADVGEGYSGPVISKGRVFVMGREAGSMETCLCFDAATGKRLWRQAYSVSYTPVDPRAGTGPKSTPTVDKDRVYMLGIGGMFTCLGVETGKVLWQHDFTKDYWGIEKDEAGADKWFPVCGVAASAIVDGQQVIVPIGGKKGGTFAAFDRNTGIMLWHALADRSSYGSPIIASLSGARQLVAFTGSRMVGINLATHELIWEYPFPALFEQTITTPIIWKDIVVISGELRPTIALRITESGSKIRTETVWRNPDLKAYLASPVIFKNHLVGVDSMAKRIVCVDLQTGQTAWTSPRIGGYVSLVVAGDRLLAQQITGELIIIRADPSKYDEIGRWKLSSAGEVWSYLAVSGSKLFVKDKEHLLCFDLGPRTASAK